jgi:hypothetical protein
METPIIRCLESRALALWVALPWKVGTVRYGILLARVTGGIASREGERVGGRPRQKDKGKLYDGKDRGGMLEVKAQQLANKLRTVKEISR